MKKNIILLAVLLWSVSFSFAQKTEENYTIKLLEACNDELSNFGTTFYGENQMIYASPDKKRKMIRDVWHPNKEPFLDLFIGDISEDGEIINGKQLRGDVKTKFHEADAVFTKDLKTVYFTRDNYYKKVRYKDASGMTHLALFKADVLDDGTWTNIQSFPYNHPSYSIGHPTLSLDESYLYFVSDMPGSKGMTDIFKVKILGDNSYGQPENLGGNINTSKREMFPFISKDNVLYFASDGWDTLGGLDIFGKSLNSNTDEKPKNLGMPINSFLDDFAFLIKDNNKNGYFSSNRLGGKGSDDIYYFEKKKPLKMPCNSKINGVVKNKKTNRRLPKAFVVLYDGKGNEIDTRTVGENAEFVFEINCNENYKVEASKNGYSVATKEITPKTNLDLVLKLEKEAVKEVPSVAAITKAVVSEAEYNSCQGALDNVNNIYFDLDKSYIRPDAASELDKVVRIMERCKNIKVIASSHTDSRASAKYNQSLSQRRAQATVDYITKVGGIPVERIKAIGYGESRLRNRCSDGVKCSEAEHQMNRRTQFNISNY